MHNNRHNPKTVIISQTIMVPAKSIIVASLITAESPNPKKCFSSAQNVKVLCSETQVFNVDNMSVYCSNYALRQTMCKFSQHHC